jgi:hypothetical protein
VDLAPGAHRGPLCLTLTGSCFDVSARGRIRIVRSHLQPTEIRAWQRDLAEGRTTTIHVGREPILLYIPPARPVTG